MSILDLLLETDAKKLELKATSEFEICRLSRILGAKFIITITPLTNKQVKHIGEISSDSNTNIKLNTILECCKIDGKKFNHKPLLEKFNCITPHDLLEKLFLPGEVFEIYEKINEISGYSKDAIIEIKN